MQYALPQFVDVEDKLIGPLTLKQFLFVFATGGLILFFYSLLKLSILFFLFAIPVGALGLTITFVKFNGRPAYGYLGAFFNFVVRPQARVFKREEPIVTISVMKEVKKEAVATGPAESTESRLRKLAYLLDQKQTEQKELMGQGKEVKPVDPVPLMDNKPFTYIR